jgi:hypothetical protein
LATGRSAGHAALRKLAAVAHLTKGLEALKTLPDSTERLEHELTLQLALGAPLQAAKGYAAPERKHAYARAWELCQQVGETPQRFPVLFGLWQCYALGAEWQKAREVGNQLLGLAERQHESLRPTGRWPTPCYGSESLPQPEPHAEQGVALYDPRQHHTDAFLYGQDPGMTCRGYAALALWVLGSSRSW